MLKQQFVKNDQGSFLAPRKAVATFLSLLLAFWNVTPCLANETQKISNAGPSNHTFLNESNESAAEDAGSIAGMYGVVSDSEESSEIVDDEPVVAESDTSDSHADQPASAEDANTVESVESPAQISETSDSTDDSVDAPAEGAMSTDAANPTDDTLNGYTLVDDSFATGEEVESAIEGGEGNDTMEGGSGFDSWQAAEEALESHDAREAEEAGVSAAQDYVESGIEDLAQQLTDEIIDSASPSDNSTEWSSSDIENIASDTNQYLPPASEEEIVDVMRDAREASNEVLVALQEDNVDLAANEAAEAVEAAERAKTITEGAVDGLQPGEDPVAVVEAAEAAAAAYEQAVEAEEAVQDAATETQTNPDSTEAEETLAEAIEAATVAINLADIAIDAATDIEQNSADAVAENNSSDRGNPSEPPATAGFGGSTPWDPNQVPLDPTELIQGYAGDASMTQQNIYGTEISDLSGTQDSDVIDASSGDDLLEGGAGDDNLAADGVILEERGPEYYHGEEVGPGNELPFPYEANPQIPIEPLNFDFPSTLGPQPDPKWTAWEDFLNQRDNWQVILPPLMEVLPPIPQDETLGEYPSPDSVADNGNPFSDDKPFEESIATTPDEIAAALSDEITNSTPPSFDVVTKPKKSGSKKRPTIARLPKPKTPNLFNRSDAPGNTERPANYGDTLFGNPGDDTIRGGPGNDHVSGDGSDNGNGYPESEIDEYIQIDGPDGPEWVLVPKGGAPVSAGNGSKSSPEREDELADSTTPSKSATPRKSIYDLPDKRSRDPRLDKRLKDNERQLESAEREVKNAKARLEDYEDLAKGVNDEYDEAREALKEAERDVKEKETERGKKYFDPDNPFMKQDPNSEEKTRIYQEAVKADAEAERNLEDAKERFDQAADNKKEVERRRAGAQKAVEQAISKRNIAQDKLSAAKRAFR